MAGGRETNAPRVQGTFIPKDGVIEMQEIDWAVLELLPMQGEKVGKFLPKVMSSPDVRKALNDNTLSGTIVAGRLRWLRAAGYAEPVKVPGRGTRGKGWQMTPAGKKALEAEKARGGKGKK